MHEDGERGRREKERESILQDRNGIRGNVLSRHDGQLVARSPTNLDRFDKSRECPTRVYTVRREIINYLAYLECYDRDRASNYNPIAARGSTRSRSRENRVEKGGREERGSPNVFVFPRFLRGSPNRPRFKFNPPGLNRSILIYEYPPIRSGGRKRDSRVIYDRIRSVICKKSIIYGRHRRRSGRFLGADEAGGKSGRAVRPIRHTARASPYTQRGISLGGDPEPVWNTGGHLPPARPCLAGPSPLGKILQNLQGRGLSPRIIPSRLSSTSLIRLRILLLFSPNSPSFSCLPVCGI